MITTLIFATLITSPPCSPAGHVGVPQDRAATTESRPPIDERVYIQIARMQQSPNDIVRSFAPRLRRKIQYWVDHLKVPMDEAPEAPKLEADVKLLSQILDEIAEKGLGDNRSEFYAVVNSFGGITDPDPVEFRSSVLPPGDRPPVRSSPPVIVPAVAPAPNRPAGAIASGSGSIAPGSIVGSALPSFNLVVKIANPEPYQTAYRIWYRPTNEFGLPAYTYTVKHGKDLVSVIKREPNINYYVWVNRFREGDTRRGLVLASETELSARVIR